MTHPAPLEHLVALVAQLERAPIEAEPLRHLADDDLLTLTQLGSTAHRLLSAHTSFIAGEVARRSRPELAHEGLAQRLGHRTAEELVRVTTGDSRRDATTAVNAGRLLVSPDKGTPGPSSEFDFPTVAPHLSAALVAVREGA